MPLSCPGKKNKRAEGLEAIFFHCCVFIWRTVCSYGGQFFLQIAQLLFWCPALWETASPEGQQQLHLLKKTKTKKKAAVYLFNPANTSPSLIASTHSIFLPSLLTNVSTRVKGVQENTVTNIDYCLLFRRSRLNEVFIGWSSPVTTLNS